MTRPTFLLAIDQGTTGTTALVLDRKLRLRARVNQEFRQYFPKPGWVEHDLEEIWTSVVRTIARALRAAGIRATQLAGIGITNQRETTALWDRRTGRPLHRAIVWQDRRTAAACEALRAEGREEWVRQRTGLVLDPYFSATKLAWLLREVRGARSKAEAGGVCAGTIDSFLVHRFTGGGAHVTDASNASRTLLLNLESLKWDPELCALFGVPGEVLPRVCGSSEVVGTTRSIPGLPDDLPIAGMAGDQQAALFGQACFRPGEAKCTYGTGAFLLMNTGSTPVRSTHGLLTTLAWKLGDQVSYALEGSAFIAGGAVQWLRDGLKIIDRASQIERLARDAGSGGGVTFVPALTGLGAPHWRPHARGLISGLERGTTAGHLAYATLEGIACQICDLVAAMEADSGRTLPALRVDGGASANDLLMQIQADLLGVPVERPRMIESTALGAAALAGLALGFWKDLDAIRAVTGIEKRFAPRLTPADRASIMTRWRGALAKA